MSINKDIEGTTLVKRVGLIIYLSSASDQYRLRRYGDIVYFSKKMKYCVLYLDKKEAKAKVREIGSLDFVTEVEYSQDENIDLTSEHIESQINDLAQIAEAKLLEKKENNEAIK